MDLIEYKQTLYLVGIVVSIALIFEIVPLLNKKIKQISEESSIDTAINMRGTTISRIFLLVFSICSFMGLMGFCILKYLELH